MAGETVEVVHEALIWRWQQLAYWMNEDRAFRVWQEKLRFSQRQWQAAGQDDGVLLRGFPLEEAIQWASERESDLSQTENDFIQSSIELQQHPKREFTRHSSQLVIVVCVVIIPTNIGALFHPFFFWIY